MDHCEFEASLAYRTSTRTDFKVTEKSYLEKKKCTFHFSSYSLIMQFRSDSLTDNGYEMWIYIHGYIIEPLKERTLGLGRCQQVKALALKPDDPSSCLEPM